jgi:hypothetical protein
MLRSVYISYSPAGRFRIQELTDWHLTFVLRGLGWTEDRQRRSAPVRDVTVTQDAVRNAYVTAVCGVCGSPLPTGRARRWCSNACRQAAFRIRQAAPRPAQPAKIDSVYYECPSCKARYLGEQRCGKCNCWCRRLGPGGPCPHCDELLALTDFLRPDQLGEEAAARSPTNSGRMRQRK